MMRRRADRRAKQDDADRAALFDLWDGELPVATLRVAAAAMHPRLNNGAPLPVVSIEHSESQSDPDDKVLEHLYDDVVFQNGWVPVLVDSAFLLTTKALRWRPIRAHRGRVPKPNRFLEEPLPFFAAQGARPMVSFPKVPPYIGYPGKSLGGRALGLSRVDQVTISRRKSTGYPIRMQVKQPKPSLRVIPFWPCYDLQPFDERHADRSGGNAVTELDARVSAQLRQFEAMTGKHVNPVTGSTPGASPYYDFFLDRAESVAVDALILSLRDLEVDVEVSAED